MGAEILSVWPIFNRENGRLLTLRDERQGGQSQNNDLGEHGCGLSGRNEGGSKEREGERRWGNGGAGRERRGSIINKR